MVVGLRSSLRRFRTVASPVVKRALSEFAAHSGLYRAARTVFGGLGVIFTLHRIARPGQPLLWPGYAIHTDHLTSLLATVRAQGWQIVTIDEIPRRLSEAQNAPFVCFTLDDGYADNLELALPVFESFAAPFCVYVCTGLIERSAFYWWGALEQLVHNIARIEYFHPGVGARVLHTHDWERKGLAYDELNEVCYQHGPEIAHELSTRYRVDWRGTMDRDFMTVDHVRTLARHPLVTIGAHGVVHRQLSKMTEAEVRADMADGRATLEAWLGREVRHLAYPFGAASACGPREFELAKAAGYATAVTTRRGNLFPPHRQHLTCLPRREVPTNMVKLRNALSGVESVFRKTPRVQTV
jgi:peptidoglycan/xylan/chitin deacetylase (PgdA/CDA1 family)